MSARTGREVVFAVWDEKRDADNDILYWTLKPVGPVGHGPDGVSLQLFND